MQVCALVTDLILQRRESDWVRIILMVRGPHGAIDAQRVVGAGATSAVVAEMG